MEGTGLRKGGETPAEDRRQALKGEAVGCAVAWDGEVAGSPWFWEWKLEKGLQGPPWPLPSTAGRTWREGKSVHILDPVKLGFIHSFLTHTHTHTHTQLYQGPGTVPSVKDSKNVWPSPCPGGAHSPEGKQVITMQCDVCCDG